MVWHLKRGLHCLRIVKFTFIKNYLFQNLKKIFFKWIADKFEPTLLKSLPKSVFSMDFDGELYFRGKTQFPSFGENSWLPEAEKLFK